MFLRYFCRVTEKPDPWGDLGFEYFSALRQTGFLIRVLALGCVDISQGRWEPFGSYFTTPVPRDYVNVICSDNGDLVRLFTIGAPNVAITAVIPDLPNDKEVGALSDYNVVVCASDQDANALRHLGVSSAMHIPPDTDSLARLFRGL